MQISQNNIWPLYLFTTTLHNNNANYYIIGKIIAVADHPLNAGVVSQSVSSQYSELLKQGVITMCIIHYHKLIKFLLSI